MYINLCAHHVITFINNTILGNIEKRKRKLNEKKKKQNVKRERQND